MSEAPDIMSDRPEGAAEIDVVSDVLRAVHLRAEVFGLLELGAPWALRVPAGDHLAFYVMARGNSRLELETDAGGGGARRLPLAAGDVVLLPHGEAHVLRDPGESAAVPRTLGTGELPRPTPREVVRFGGGGEVTAFVAGAFRLDADARNVLLETLPRMLHRPAAEASADPHVSAIVQLILAECTSPGPGSRILTARLAEIILVQALRTEVAARDGSQCGLRALSDPAIGAALRLMHVSPAEPWSVERLARAVGLSRSAFAARFTERVGEAPLQYLTRWRMTLAAERLRDSGDSIRAIAVTVGYQSPTAFRKAFSRTRGTGPGAYRRAHRRHGTTVSGGR